MTKLWNLKELKQNLNYL